MAAAYAAGASNLPFAMLRGYQGTELNNYNPQIKSIQCPFTGEVLAAVPAIRPDVTVIHAQKADRKGNVLIWGVLGVQKEAVMAAKRAIVTVEEIVDDLQGSHQRAGAAHLGADGRLRSEARGISVLCPRLLSAQ